MNIGYNGLWGASGERRGILGAGRTKRCSRQFSKSWTRSVASAKHAAHLETCLSTRPHSHDLRPVGEGLLRVTTGGPPHAVPVTHLFLREERANDSYPAVTFSGEAIRRPR
jgi:hypothetical protein